MRLLLVILLALASNAAASMNLTVVSFNVRWANPLDGKNVWSNRRDLAGETLAKSGGSVIGLQEALAGQLADLKARMPGFESIGVGRDDGKKAGEFSAILYDARQLDVEKNGTFWLSETPETPGSMSWDTACTRIATWGIFHDKKSGTRFFMINTHLDHKSEQAQEEGAKLIASRIKELAGDLPVIVTGDFNCSAKSAPVQTLVSEVSLQLAEFVAMKTSRATTFNGFGKAESGDGIDHIIVSKNVAVDSWDVLKAKSGDVFVSDHWPVAARLSIP